MSLEAHEKKAKTVLDVRASQFRILSEIAQQKSEGRCVTVISEFKVQRWTYSAESQKIFPCVAHLHRFE